MSLVVQFISFAYMHPNLHFFNLNFTVVQGCKHATLLLQLKLGFFLILKNRLQDYQPQRIIYTFQGISPRQKIYPEQ